MFMLTCPNCAGIYAISEAFRIQAQPVANALIAEMQSGANAPNSEVSNISGDPQIWASEESVDSIISSADQISQEDSALIDREVLSAEAMVLVTNIADKQKEEVIADITTKVLEGYKIDLESRKEWEELNKQIIDLAKLIVKKKTYAGEVVANVKYPLIINACIQFAARAYPEIVKGNEIVKGKVIGIDPAGVS